MTKVALLAVCALLAGCAKKPLAPEKRVLPPGVHALDEPGLTPPQLLRSPSASLPSGFWERKRTPDPFVYEGEVDDTGQVRHVRLVKAPVITPPDPDAEGIVRGSLEAWVYRPAELYGKRVRVAMTWEIPLGGKPYEPAPAMPTPILKIGF